MVDRELSNAEAQAVAQLESIKEMVAALSVDYDRLDELREEREELAEAVKDADDDERDAAEAALAEWDEDNAEELAELIEAAGECKDEDDARQRMDEDPLSIEVRGGWHTPSDDDNGAAEYCILLCTGGPACRIVGDLDQHKQPTSARLEYQDWGTPWTEHITTHADRDTLLAYAQHFSYGE